MHQLTKEQKQENLQEVYAAKQQKFFKLKEELNNLTKKLLKLEPSFQPSHLSKNDFEELKQDWELQKQKKQES